MATLQLRLFGDFQVSYNGDLIKTFHQARLQSLLAYLVLHRDAPQPRQRLAFLFWPDSSEAQAHANCCTVCTVLCPRRMIFSGSIPKPCNGAPMPPLPSMLQRSSTT